MSKAGDWFKVPDRPIPNERPVRLTSMELADAQKGIEEDRWTVDDVLAKHPTLVPEQVDVLRGVKTMAQ